jgi:hypothetical protein
MKEDRAPGRHRRKEPSMKRISRLAVALVLITAAHFASLSPRPASASQIGTQGVCLNRTFCAQCDAAGGLCATLDGQCYCYFLG